MISFAIGIAIGAAFAPVWMKVYAVLKTLVASKLPK